MFVSRFVFMGLFFYVLLTHNCFSQNGLVAHWDFTDNGTYQTTDIVGGLSAYMTSGAEFVDDPAPNGGSHALRCNYSDLGGIGSSDLEFNINHDSFSISAWVKTSDTPGNRIVTVSSGSSSGYWLELVDGGTFGIQPGGVIPLRVSSASGISLEDGQYHHLVGVHDAVNQQIRIYIDGQYSAEASTAGMSGLVSGYRFNFCSAGSGFQFVGNIDEIKIFNRTLSDFEIGEEAGNLSPPPTDNAISLADALDNTNITWRSGGNSWFGQDVVTHDLNDAAQSANINDNEYSRLLALVTGPGSGSFYWKVSSERNYDQLSFHIEGVLQSSISGDVGWEKYSFSLPEGDHILSWRYEKDCCTSNGSDAGYVDSLVFGTEGPSFNSHSPIKIILPSLQLLLNERQRLISTVWDQADPFKYSFNSNLEPCDASSVDDGFDDYVVGCSSIAIGQLINYYFQRGYRAGWLEQLLENVTVYPRFGLPGLYVYKSCLHKGLTTEAAYPNSINLKFSEDGLKLRQFLWDVALGLDSHFNLPFSGDTAIREVRELFPGTFETYEDKIKSLLHTRFRFRSDIVYSNELTRLDTEKDYIIESIDKKEPVLTALESTDGGHMVLIDNYRLNNGKFEVLINWGWGNHNDENDIWIATDGPIGAFTKFRIFKNTTPINYP